MPTLTIPTKYVTRLKELGIYDQWLHNVQEQWDEIECRLNPSCPSHPLYIEQCIDEYNIACLILSSFQWEKTVEGIQFWYDIYKSIC